MSRVVVAILLVTSVRKVTAKQMVAIIRSNGSVESCCNDCPIVPLRPELMKPVAMVMPAPNNNSMPQGMRSAVSQSSSRSASPASLVLPLGITNSATTAKNATMASLAFGRENHSLHPPQGPLRVIHNPAVTANTASTRRSASVHLPLLGSATPPC